MSDVKVSADQHTRDKLALPESMTADEAQAKARQIKEANAGYTTKIEGNTLTVKRLLRD